MKRASNTTLVSNPRLVDDVFEKNHGTHILQVLIYTTGAQVLSYTTGTNIYYRSTGTLIYYRY